MVGLRGVILTYSGNILFVEWTTVFPGHEFGYPERHAKYRNVLIMRGREKCG